MWFTLCILVSVIALSRGVPQCTGLGKYTMQSDVKDHVVQRVLLYSPGKEIASISSVYDCDLEKMAGEILDDPHKPIAFLKDIGIYPLIYSIEGRGEDNVRLMTHAALHTWKEYIEKIPFFTFGCNYRKQYGDRHYYLCLLRHKAE
ncbi:hypothetical protein Y032_0457g1806 [Ancylostoma ceylanicum]|uniref:SCP domain-containing protein n=1 Tax=Ancylostoma ceylanicum TaxID=53326 RepID=A0A016WY62_9BILA|nr:hypothetical protein Y032_0457g1806 [Ancylostoma ceylanicum]